MGRVHRFWILAAALAASALPAGHAHALPTFQAYIDGATGTSIGEDLESWFLTGDTFDLFVVGAYGANDTSITNVTLLISVPQGETGTISITSVSDGTPTLLTTAVLVDPFNPNANADTDILTDVTGLDGYTDKDFLPPDASFGNHYPFKADVSDFVLFDLDSFSNAEGPLHNYNAATNTTDVEPNSSGEQKEYAVSFTGFSRLHFDVYGLVTSTQGQTRIATTWDINASSHDSTAKRPPVVPVPGSAPLMALGLGAVAWLRRRFA